MSWLLALVVGGEAREEHFQVVPIDCVKQPVD